MKHGIKLYDTLFVVMEGTASGLCSTWAAPALFLSISLALIIISPSRCRCSSRVWPVGGGSAAHTSSSSSSHKDRFRRQLVAKSSLCFTRYRSSMWFLDVFYACAVFCITTDCGCEWKSFHWQKMKGTTNTMWLDKNKYALWFFRKKILTVCNHTII